MSNSQKGFAHLLAVLVIGVGITATVLAFIPVSRHYNDGKSSVEGTTTASNSAKPDFNIQKDSSQTAIVNQRVGALSNFPLTINSKTNELTVTTPAGTKVVTVLPQQAVSNMLTSKIMDDVISEPANGSLASVPNLVKLDSENGVLGYDIKGTRTHKLLGIIPIKTSVEVFVSAENGQVVDTKESFLAKILDKIAP